MGFFFFLDPIIDIVEDIIKAFAAVSIFILFLLEKIPYILNLAFDLVNPNKLINGIIGGVKASLILVYNFVKNLFGGSNIYNKLIPKGLMNSGGIFGLKKGSSNGTCIQPTIFRLILMIVCPPFALFMKIGLASWGWFYIIICTVLTIYAYYFPGLIYAAMHILC